MPCIHVAYIYVICCAPVFKVYITSVRLRVQVVLQNVGLEQQYYIDKWHVFLPSEVFFDSRQVTDTPKLIGAVAYQVCLHLSLWLQALPAKAFGSWWSNLVYFILGTCCMCFWLSLARPLTSFGMPFDPQSSSKNIPSCLIQLLASIWDKHEHSYLGDFMT